MILADPGLTGSGLVTRSPATAEVSDIGGDNDAVASWFGATGPVDPFGDTVGEEDEDIGGRKKRLRKFRKVMSGGLDSKKGHKVLRKAAPVVGTALQLIPGLGTAAGAAVLAASAVDKAKRQKSKAKRQARADAIASGAGDPGIVLDEGAAGSGVALMQDDLELDPDAAEAAGGSGAEAAAEGGSPRPKKKQGPGGWLPLAAVLAVAAWFFLRRK